MGLEGWLYQFAGDTVAVVVEQESHGWEDQLGDRIGELSAPEAEAMTVSDYTEYLRRPVVAMILVVEAEEEHSGAVDVAKALQEGSPGLDTHPYTRRPNFTTTLSVERSVPIKSRLAGSPRSKPHSQTLRATKSLLSLPTHVIGRLTAPSSSAERPKIQFTRSGLELTTSETMPSLLILKSRAKP